MEHRKIAILVDNYFEQTEFEESHKNLKEAGAVVSVISTRDKGLQAVEDGRPSELFRADTLISDIDFEDYDGLLLPGGIINADKLRMHERARAWVSYSVDNGKLIAAMCHAPWLLVSADLVEERRVTSYFTLQDDIRNAGGEWIDQPIVSDGNIITGQQSKDIPAFLDTIRQWFKDH